MKKKIALITGINGQDGAYLSKLLLSKNYRVFGAERRNSSGNYWRLKKLGCYDDIELIDFEITEFSNVQKVIKLLKPDEIYNLAAQSFVSLSFDVPVLTSDITAIGCLRILESIREYSKNSKFYQASSSEMYGDVLEPIQNEKTPFNPQSPYAISKLYAHFTTINYRNSYNLFACSGILFNHESPLRGSQFVTKKIVEGLVDVVLKRKKYLEVGNLYAKRDWGYAGDYVTAMHKMLNYKYPEDFVIATGKCHTVKDFINQVCKNLNLKIKWIGSGLNEKCINLENNQIIIKISKKFFRPSEVNFLLGDYSNAKRKLKWKPKSDFKDLVKMMVDDELSYKT